MLLQFPTHRTPNEDIIAIITYGIIPEFSLLSINNNNGNENCENDDDKKNKMELLPKNRVFPLFLPCLLPEKKCVMCVVFF